MCNVDTVPACQSCCHLSLWHVTGSLLLVSSQAADVGGSETGDSVETESQLKCNVISRGQCECTHHLCHIGFVVLCVTRMVNLHKYSTRQWGGNDWPSNLLVPVCWMEFRHQLVYSTCSHIFILDVMYKFFLIGLSVNGWCGLRDLDADAPILFGPAMTFKICQTVMSRKSDKRDMTSICLLCVSLGSV